MIPSAWLKGLFGFLVKGNGIGDGSEYVHANQVILSDGVTGDYDELNRIVTVTSEGAGSTGATGPGYYATSPTSLLIAAAEKTFTTQAGLAYIAGSRARAVSAADSANYMEGVVTGYTGTTLVITVDTIGGSGTHTDWRISLTGAIGPAGPTGAGYLATSASTLLLQSGEQTAVTQAGLAYVANDHVRVSHDGSTYMQASVVSYSGTSLVFNAYGVAGSGSESTWTISLMGSPGVGATGATGAGVATTSTTSAVIETGSNKTFIVDAGLAYFPGMRLKLISRANTANWIEGPIVLYSGTEVTVYAERIGGSGTKTDWDISVAGDVGATGATGPTGISTFGPFGFTAGSSGSTAPGWCSTNTGADLYHSSRTLVQVQMPRSGTITGWSVYHGLALSVNLDYDIEINGVGLTVWLAVLATEQYGSMTMLDLPFARGDLLSIYVTPCGAAYAKVYLEVVWDDA